MNWLSNLIIKALLLFFSIFCFAGCAGYRLGSTLPPDVRSVYVPLFENKSREPLLENQATAATIAELQKDGTLKVVNAGQADVVLECVLTSISLNPLRYNRSDPTKPNEYRLTLNVSYILRRTRNREVLSEGTAIGEGTFPFTGNLGSAKQTAMPAATQDLAKRIVERVIEAW